MKLFLSGCESFDTARIARDYGTDSLLFSNYHRGEIKLEEFKGKNLMMDSGLFTMMFGSGKGKTYTKEDLLAYTDKYIGDMLAMDWPGVIVDMDVHRVLGVECVPEFRAKFETRWGIERTVFVWHVEETVEGLGAMAKRYPYIALGIPELRIVFGKNFKEVTLKLLKFIHATNPKCKVHLLGCTQKALMENPHYFSCDSSSWLYPVQYGGFFLFLKDNKLRWDRANQKETDMDSVWKTLFPGKPPTVLKNKKYGYVLGISADAYRKLEAHINQRFYPYDNRPLI